MSESDRSWLTSKNRELAEVSVGNLAHKAIDQAVQQLTENFSPEECADIVLSAFMRIVENPDTREDIIAWVKSRQS